MSTEITVHDVSKIEIDEVIREFSLDPTQKYKVIHINISGKTPLIISLFPEHINVAVEVQT